MGAAVHLSGHQVTAGECPNPSSRDFRTPGELFLVASLFGPTAGLFLALVAGKLSVAQYVPLHLGVCATGATLGLCWIWWSEPSGHAASRTAALLTAMFWVLLAGPFGAAIAATLLLSRTAPVETTRWLLVPASAEQPERTRLEVLHNSLLDRRLRLEHAHGIRPLLDVMIDGTPTEKLEALRVSAKHYVPGLAPAIRRGLEDRDAAVRVFAATVMAQQNNWYTRRIGALQTAAHAAPDCSDRWFELAQAHADYAASGLLDTSRADAETRQAEAYLVRATQVTPATELV